MQGKILAMVALTFGAVWMLSPVLEELDGRGQGSVQDETFPEAQPEQSYDWYAGSTTLERKDDGHFYADVVANGSDVHFLVDTGASFVALTADDALNMGLNWDDSDIRPIGYGASGPVMGVQTSIEVMELGGFTAHNVSAAIIPQGLQVSLLGQSFLAKVGKVEIRDDQMVFQGY